MGIINSKNFQQIQQVFLKLQKLRKKNNNNIKC